LPSILEAIPHGVDYGIVSNNADRAGFDAYVPADWLIASVGSGGVVAVKVAGDDIGSVWLGRLRLRHRARRGRHLRTPNAYHEPARGQLV
jgi:hypothetical protein